MHPDDVSRELDKIEYCLDWVEKYLDHYNSANAALHMNTTVLPSPLAIAVKGAFQAVDNVRAHLAE
jgi:hypothetical protein